ncbi:ankyrin repeat domain-containing protein [Mycobacteroides abscessus]|uniref:ankyrin repeat domain-containing protein n=1 Tax=Mycobacteroides abscessus TaxID=36809 RepID=UPI00025846AF|nr:ankyrin repeat domain-containing protein [Mycobacteroides abscessus]EIC67557.1 Ankyrin [Mycobacteroides abscessus M93]
MDTADTAELISLARTGDHAALQSAVDRGASLDGRDESGWTALDWTAGRGDTAAMRILLDAGAQAGAAGPDGRTPYDIALAAGHRQAAQLLREVTGAGASRWAPYCRGYSLAELRRFPGWPAGDASEPDDTVVYLHDDLSVTRSIWPGEDVMWDEASAPWEQFCTQVLRFEVPDDLDLIPVTDQQ